MDAPFHNEHLEPKMGGWLTLPSHSSTADFHERPGPFSNDAVPLDADDRDYWLFTDDAMGILAIYKFFSAYVHHTGPATVLLPTRFYSLLSLKEPPTLVRIHPVATGTMAFKALPRRGLHDISFSWKARFKLMSYRLPSALWVPSEVISSNSSIQAAEGVLICHLPTLAPTHLFLVEHLRLLHFAHLFVS